MQRGVSDLVQLKKDYLIGEIRGLLKDLKDKYESLPLRVYHVTSGRSIRKDAPVAPQGSVSEYGPGLYCSYLFLEAQPRVKDNAAAHLITVQLNGPIFRSKGERGSFAPDEVSVCIGREGDHFFYLDVCSFLERYPNVDLSSCKRHGFASKSAPPDVLLLIVLPEYFLKSLEGRKLSYASHELQVVLYNLRSEKMSFEHKSLISE